MHTCVIAFALVLGTVVANDTADVEHRIIGGLTAPDGEYPYQISLRTPQNKHFCGGSIISSKWVLTVARCVYRKTASSMIIVVGTNFLNTGGTVYGVKQVIWHSGYLEEMSLNDIAVLEVAGSINFNAKVRNVALPAAAIPSGTSCTLTGWGVTKYPSTVLSNALQHISLTAITVQQCQTYLPNYPVYSTNLCTLQSTGKGACEGDTGSPLVCKNLQHGIVSWGIACAKGKPDVHTSVASYRDWIKQQTGV